MRTPSPQTINGNRQWDDILANLYLPLAARIDELVAGGRPEGSRVLMGGLKNGYLPQLLPHIQFDVIEANEAQKCPHPNVTLFNQNWYDVKAWPPGPHAVVVEDLGDSLRRLKACVLQHGDMTREIQARLRAGAVLLAPIQYGRCDFIHEEWRIP